MLASCSVLLLNPAIQICRLLFSPAVTSLMQSLHSCTVLEATCDAQCRLQALINGSDHDDDDDDDDDIGPVDDDDEQLSMSQ